MRHLSVDQKENDWNNSSHSLHNLSDKMELEKNDPSKNSAINKSEQKRTESITDTDDIGFRYWNRLQVVSENLCIYIEPLSYFYYCWGEILKFWKKKNSSKQGLYFRFIY